MLQHTWIFSWLYLNKNTFIFFFLTLYWWYLYGMDKTWKTAKTFYKQTKSKTSLCKVRLKLEFLDTLVYIDQQNKLQTNLKIKWPSNLSWCKIRIRRICPTFQDYHSHSRKLIEQLFDRGYKKDVVIQQIEKVDQLKSKATAAPTKTSW